MQFLIGGARSGKSRLGVRLAAAAAAPVHVVVTATASDDEMAYRIQLHRRERPQAWATVEAPHDLITPLRTIPATDCVLIDCVSVWVSNRMADGITEDEIVDQTRQATALAIHRPGTTIVVTNEVGQGLVPMHPVGRAYRDTLGRVNVAWSEAATEAWYVVAGRVLPLRHP